MNNQEVIMRNALPSTGLIAHRKALEAAGIAIAWRLLHPTPLTVSATATAAISVDRNQSRNGQRPRGCFAPAGCQVRHCASTLIRSAFLFAQCRTWLPRVLPRGQFFRLPLRPPLVQSAWSMSFPLPPNDHADWATLGRHGGPVGRGSSLVILVSGDPSTRSAALPRSG